MKNILVPTDFSANARNAMQYAIELARLFDSQLTLVHTFFASRRGDMLVSMESIMRKDAEQEMDTLTKEIPADVRWESKILMGESISSIAKCAEEIEADLIVMGTQGASGWEEVFIGSVTGGVMRQTKVPLLAIPENFSYRPLKKIVLAMASLKVSQPEVMIRPLKELAEKLQVHVHIYHHDQSHEELPESVSEAVDWLGNLPVSITYEQDADQVNKNISEFVKENEADLLCMIRRNRSTFGFFEKLFTESVTLTQVFRCEVPLLILHAPDK